MILLSLFVLKSSKQSNLTLNLYSINFFSVVGVVKELKKLQGEYFFTGEDFYLQKTN